MQTIHLLIKGKVQGVFYRASAKEQAERLSLTGWVKNTPEGNVEITATGEPAALDQFTIWCRQGPARALITDVERKSLPATTFEDFQILHG